MGISKHVLRAVASPDCHYSLPLCRAMFGYFSPWWQGRRFASKADDDCEADGDCEADASEVIGDHGEIDHKPGRSALCTSAPIPNAQHGKLCPSPAISLMRLSPSGALATLLGQPKKNSCSAGRICRSNP